MPLDSSNFVARVSSLELRKFAAQSATLENKFAADGAMVQRLARGPFKAPDLQQNKGLNRNKRTYSRR